MRTILSVAPAATRSVSIAPAATRSVSVAPAATRFVSALLAGALFVSAGPLSAHHAFSAEFDADQPVTLRGTVTRVEWINPHAWIHIDVEGEDGNVESWMIEAGSPNTLVRRGMTRDSIPAGTEVVVFGYRHRNGSNAANGRDVTLPDGSKLFLSSPRTGAPGGDER